MSGDLRWKNYVLRSGTQFSVTWRSLREERDRHLLYILGLGFDERMCDGLEAVLLASQQGRCDACLLTFDEGAGSPSQAHGAARTANEARFAAIVGRAGCRVHARPIQLVSDDGRRIGSRSIARVFAGGSELSAYTDVVVDISALPRSLYFPLIAKLLSIYDRAARPSLGDARHDDSRRVSSPVESVLDRDGAGDPGPEVAGPPWNLHVVVAHSPDLDASTQDEGIEESATFLHGFSAAEFEREATREQPRVWLPVLGRGQRAQIERILNLVTPDEICPVVPSPARNPREPDNLMLEYREILFDQLRVEPRNVIYASEANPFEVYRQIVRSVRHYQRALEPLGGCKAVVSAMSSKLASVGALLAAYELRDSRYGKPLDVGVAHVEAEGYVVNRPADLPPATLVHLWLAGECHVE